jgi:hypothetical protein
MRVYVPATLHTVADLVERRVVGPAPVAAFAVTAAVRAAAPGTDLDELAEDAMATAADAALGLLAADPTSPRRRVVVAADVPDPVVEETDPVTGAVLVRAEIAIAAVASVHVDDVDAEPDVSVAVSAWPTASDAADGHALLWYATQELADLVSGT